MAAYRSTKNPTPSYAELTEAARKAHELLQQHGIPHAICGGLAVVHYGYVRTTTDIDLLVDDRAFTHHGSIVAPKVPMASVDEILVDLVSFTDDESLVREALDAATSGATDGLPIVSLNMLIYMKLRANRPKDLADLVELLKAGAVELQEADAFVVAKCPQFLARWRHAKDLSTQ